MSGTIKRFVKENYVLVGDAAGMVLLLSNGAGITIAMLVENNGQTIAKHVIDGTPLTNYEKIWHKQMGKVMKNLNRSFKIGSLMFRMPDRITRLVFSTD